MNFTILKFETLPSTNTEAMRQARRGAAEGVCITARQQTAGRGRRERVWHSPPDAGIYFSAIFRPRFEREKWALLTLMAAAAIHESVLTTCGLRTDIKWANDIHSIAGKKLSGILAETADTPQGVAVILGIGINLRRSAVAPELAEIATSIENETGDAPNSEKILAALTANLSEFYGILHEPAGNTVIIEEWTRRSSYATGKTVRVTLENETLTGETRGLEPDGALRVEIADGQVKKIYAGDVVAVRA